MQAVLYHHIGAETPFEAGLGVTTHPELFEAQIDWLARRYRFIDLDTLLTGKPPRNALLLTFDDAFRSVLHAARDVLAPRGIPAVFFINPDMLEPEAVSLDSVWAWAVQTFGAARASSAVGLPERTDLSTIIGHDMARLSARARADVRQRLLDTFGSPDLLERAPLLAPEDLVELTHLGVEVGNHTASHVHCRSLKPNELASELVGAQARLSELAGRPVRSFSAPYGHETDLTPTVIDALRDSGHKALFLVHARSNRWRPAADIWYRVNMLNHAPKKLNRVMRVEPLLRSIKAGLSR